YFFNRVDALLHHEEDFDAGVLVVAHLNDLAIIDKTLGHKETDALLRRLGEALESLTRKDKNLMAGRLSGTDFAVFSSVPADSFALASTVKGLLIKAAGLQ